MFFLSVTLLSKGQTAAFTFQSASGNFCEPTTVNFTQTSTDNPLGYNWSFGNGSSSNAANPTTTYNTAGTYTVTLTAIYANSTAQTSQTITINPAITLSLAADRNYICTPGTINFNASTTANISNYQFDFGDGTAVVNTPNNTISHNFSSFGNYSVSVTATSLQGCTKTAVEAVSVRNPTVSGTVSPSSGCVPALVTYTASSALPTGGTITNYNWNFGDGNTQSTINASTTYSYPNVGSYTGTVSITTNEGCTGSFTFPSISFGIPPTGTVAYTLRPVICGSETAILIGKATNANTYLWDFGDGNTQVVTDTIVNHKYSTLGMKTVSVTPYFNGCPGAAQNFTVNVVGVIVGFNYANTCNNRNRYTFLNTSQGNISTNIWSFGDGSSSVFTTNTSHTYPLNGSFTTQLLIIDSATGCRDSLQQIIYTARPTLTNVDSVLCKYAPTTFVINNNYSNPGNSYTWQVLGQTIPNQTAPSTFNADILGNFTNNSVIINYGTQSCADTITLNRPILVRGPNLDFTLPSSICAESSVTITNNSRPFVTNDTVRLWYWNYGTSATNDTIFQPRPRAYSTSGSYTVKLAAIDKNGCKDSLSKTVTINPLPYLIVVPQRDTLCAGQQSTLIAFHSDSLLWNNSNTLSCATCDTTIASPSITTNYVATATNVFGCNKSDTARILVFTAFQATVSATNNFLCSGDSLQLNALPTGKVIRWTPTSSLSDSTVYNPIIRPTTSTTYTALLTDSIGCFSSSAQVVITVKSTPTVDAGPDIILPYANTATISPMYSSNTISYLWEPATNLNCTNCATPLVVALKSQLYSITATSDSGCIAKDSIRVIVECKDAYLYFPTAFSPNADGRNDFFYPMTRGIASVTKFVIYNRYGNLVFSRNGFLPNIASLGWNGKVNNLPQDQTSYVYIMEAICDQGQKLVKKGSFILLR